MCKGKRGMSAASYHLNALLVGPLRPLGPEGVPSGIAKSPVREPVHLAENGFLGDAQGDLRVHGGPHKAVHHYPLDHYAAWVADIGPHDLLSAPGAFGENLSVSGLSEADVAIGDLFALGSALLEVSQGRQPCWKLNARFSRNSMARDVQKTGRTGWYYRVIRTGPVTPTDRLRRIERRSPEWTVERIWRAFYVDMLNRRELEAIAELSALAPGWRDHARKRLLSGTVEDWSRRLDGR